MMNEANRACLFLGTRPNSEIRRLGSGRISKGPATLPASISAWIFCPTISGCAFEDCRFFFASVGLRYSVYYKGKPWENLFKIAAALSWSYTESSCLWFWRLMGVLESENKWDWGWIWDNNRVEPLVSEPLLFGTSLGQWSPPTTVERLGESVRAKILGTPVHVSNICRGQLKACVVAMASPTTVWSCMRIFARLVRAKPILKVQTVCLRNTHVFMLWRGNARCHDPKP